MIDWQDLRSRERDWTRISQDAISWRRSLLERMTSFERLLFSTALERVARGYELLQAGYIPPGYRDKLEPDSAVANVTNPEHLLAIASTHMRRSRLQSWFDALSWFDHALAVAQIEALDPRERAGMVIYDLIQFLQQHLFAKTFRETPFYAYYDPTRDYTVGSRDVGIGRRLSRKGRVCQTHRLMCRSIRENGIVYVRDRVKDPLGVRLKMHRQVEEARRASPWSVDDRCGLMLVVEKRESISGLAEQLTGLFQKHGAVVTEPLKANFDTDATVDANNGSSSSKYKVAKMRIRWNGQEFELQFIAFFDYFNARYSLSEENHQFYRLRQHLDFTFPWLWPQAVYGIAWDNPQVRHIVHKGLQAQLPWPLQQPSR